MGDQWSDGSPTAFGRFVAACRARPAVTLILIGGVTAVGYLCVHLLWPSDAQRAKRAVSAALDALTDGDVARVMSHVSPYFSAEGVDKDALSGMLERSLTRHDFLRASLTFQQIQVINGRAALKVHVRSFHRSELGGGMVNSEWVIILEELGGQWLVREATPVSVNGRRIAGLRGVLYAGY
jgi:hypothetical protein